MNDIGRHREKLAKVERLLTVADKEGKQTGTTAGERAALFAKMFIDGKQQTGLKSRLLQRKLDRINT